jgi:DNA-binding XRE family transcriptional regulator
MATQMTFKEVRKHLGMTKQQMAAHLGCAESSISRWEKEQNVPHPMFMEKINRLMAKALKPDEAPLPQ